MSTRAELADALEEALRAMHQPRWGFLRGVHDAQRLFRMAEHAIVVLRQPQPAAEPVTVDVSAL
jgi:hypothetical protein